MTFMTNKLLAISS